MLVGGGSVRDDIRILRDGKAQVVAGTPGRVMHMIKNNVLGRCRLKIRREGKNENELRNARDRKNERTGTNERERK